VKAHDHHGAIYRGMTDAASGIEANLIVNYWPLTHSLSSRGLSVALAAIHVMSSTVLCKRVVLIDAVTDLCCQHQLKKLSFSLLRMLGGEP
jgi:hypothetical protein